MALTVSDDAAARVEKAMPPERRAAGDGLRIAVQGGGCSGVTYKMDFDAPRERDKVFDVGAIKLLVDPKSYFYVNGSELVYTTSLTGSGFSLNNPNVKGACGCGVSFQI